MAADSLILLQRAIGSTVQPPEDPLSERILDAAFEISAASRVKNLTMDELAHPAGVGRVTVYRRLSTGERREEERRRLRRGERTPQVAA
jgi:hypothetical protein